VNLKVFRPHHVLDSDMNRSFAKLFSYWVALQVTTLLYWRGNDLLL